MVRDRANLSGIAVASELSKGAPTLFADERKVKQILLNLLANAIKFTPRRGNVRISLKRHDNGDIAIVVADTGIGIAKTDLATVMEPFGQIDSGLDRKHEGAGLGLPLSRALAELHGGSLEIDSEIDVGTRVVVRFPSSRVGGLEPDSS